MTAVSAPAGRPLLGEVGVGRLIRLAARRDRLMVPIWTAVLVLVCFASASATTSVYPTEAERVKAAEAINASPGIVALYGPILDVHSKGELAMTKMTVLYAVFAAMMFLFVVRRHTRLAEEGGQSELLGGTAIDRDAPLTAAIAFGSVLAVALGLLVAVATVVGGLPVTGSLAFGASWAGTGLVATGLTAAACQVSASARTCAAIAASVLGVLYGLRAVGDTTAASWLSWLTPFGWNTQLRAYSDPRWWLLLAVRRVGDRAGRARTRAEPPSRPGLRPGRRPTRTGHRLPAPGRRGRARGQGAHADGARLDGWLSS